MQFNPAQGQSQGGGGTGSAYGNLLYRYVHSGNKTIYPTSVDLTTGIFTTDTPIGLPSGAKRLILTAIDDRKNNQLPREWRAIDTHSIEIIDDYSFYVLNGSQTSTTRMTYPNASNTAIDLTSFHFEYDFVSAPIFDVSGLDLKNIKIRAMGHKDRGGYAYLFLNGTHDTGTLNGATLGHIDGRDYQTHYYETEVRYHSEIGVLIVECIRTIQSTWADTNGTWTTTASASNVGALMYYFDNFNLSTIKPQYNLANGYVYEIYDMG